MKLIDFKEFEAFNTLRRRLGTDQMGHFELFDPSLHLTGVERSSLAREGLSINVHELRYLLDFTVVFKNSRVFIIEPYRFHVARCQNVKKLDGTVLIGTHERLLAPAARVCPDCLQVLHYQGYDAHKARREHYSQQVLDAFRLPVFWQQYPFYPVSEHRDLRKKIHEA